MGTLQGWSVPSEVCPRDRTRLGTLQVRLAWSHSNPGVCPSEVCPRARTRLGTLHVVSPEHISILVWRPWRARAHGVHVSLAYPVPLAYALRLDSALTPRWCAHAHMECAQLNLAWVHSKLSPLSTIQWGGAWSVHKRGSPQPQPNPGGECFAPLSL